MNSTPQTEQKHTPEQEIKPCPFCGGEAYYLFADPGAPYPGGYPMVICRNSEKEGNLCISDCYHSGPKCLGENEEQGKADAIAAWNTRALPGIQDPAGKPNPMNSTPQTEQKHTPEPWILDTNQELPVCIIESTGTGFGIAEFGDWTRTNVANAERIVACVNALTGIQDPEGVLKEVREALELSAVCLDWDNREIADKVLSAIRKAQKSLSAISPTKV